MQIVGRLHQWSLCLRMSRKGIQLKTTTLLVFFSVVSKAFEKLVNNRIIDQHDFRSSLSTANCLTVVSDRIPRAFNRSGATRAVAIDIFKAFDRAWQASLLQKLKSHILLLVIDGFDWFWMGSLHKNIQLMLEFLKAPFLVLHFRCYTLMTFLTMLSVILLSMLMTLLFLLSVTWHLI